MIAKTDEATLRAWVADGKTDAEIAETLGSSARTVRRALQGLGIKRERTAKGEPRSPGYVLRFADEAQRAALHAAARTAGRDTSEWLLELAIDGPKLARTARDTSIPTKDRRLALAGLFELLAGPKEAGGDDASEE